MATEQRTDRPSSEGSPSDLPLRDALRSFADNLSRLLMDHLALARAELKLEGERLLYRGVLIGVALLWGCVGYLALMGALVALLAQGLSVALAALIVGLANLGGGVALLMFATRAEKADEPPLGTLSKEIEQDVKLAEQSIEKPVKPRPLAR
jgi:uncharacterized membrane protein YqjE